MAFRLQVQVKASRVRVRDAGLEVATVIHTIRNPEAVASVDTHTTQVFIARLFEGECEFDAEGDGDLRFSWQLDQVNDTVQLSL